MENYEDADQAPPIGRPAKAPDNPNADLGDDDQGFLPEKDEGTDGPFPNPFLND